MLKKVFIIMYVLGIVLICALRTPVKYYQFYDRFIVIHTHILVTREKSWQASLCFIFLSGQSLFFLRIFCSDTLERIFEIFLAVAKQSDPY